MEHSYKALKDLATSAGLAVLKDAHDILEDQSRVIYCIAQQSRSLTTDIAALNKAIDVIQLNYKSKL